MRRVRKSPSICPKWALSSPATMCWAPAMVANSACGTSSRKWQASAGVSTLELLPRTSKVGVRRLLDAAPRRAGSIKGLRWTG